MANAAKPYLWGETAAVELHISGACLLCMLDLYICSTFLMHCELLSLHLMSSLQGIAHIAVYDDPSYLWMLGGHD